MHRRSAVNDALFYVMDFVDGVVMHSDEVSSVEMPNIASHGDRRAPGRRCLRRCTPSTDDIGLGDLGRKEAFLDRQLKRWSTQWEGSKTRELTQMDEAYAGLMASKPEQRHRHRPRRLPPGNMLVDPVAGSVSAVLDRELCTLGDVLADLGYLLNNWVELGDELACGKTSYPTAIAGLLGRSQIVERYIEKTGFEVGNVDYYRAFQACASRRSSRACSLAT
ncbi:MAG: phosphotransferase [Acidimicrobiales bacterium]